MRKAGASRLERFEEKYIPEPNSGCFLWFAATTGRDGRGSFTRSYPEKGSDPAPRVAWELYRGPIPLGMDVLHSCDMPCCVNPDHLWLGVHKENMHDCIKKGRFVYPPTMRGEDCRQSKLTEDQVIEIRSRVLKNREYAVKFGVREDHIACIQMGKLWAHLPVIEKKPIVRTAEEWEISERKAAYCREWRRLKKLSHARHPQ